MNRAVEPDKVRYMFYECTIRATHETAKKVRLTTLKDNSGLAWILKTSVICILDERWSRHVLHGLSLYQRMRWEHDCDEDQ